MTREEIVNIIEHHKIKVMDLQFEIEGHKEKINYWKGKLRNFELLKEQQ